MRKFLVFFFIFLSFFNHLQSKEVINCNYFTEKYGKKFNIPNKLLTSISLVESGVKKGDKFVSWPWTLNVAGKSKYFKNKEQTLVFIKKNLSKVNKIDVGCMQINLKYHGQEFKNFEHVLDPESNVKYAAKHLRELFGRYKTWNEAVSRYHSSKPLRKKRYLNKVHSFWAELRQKKFKVESQSKFIEKQKIEFFKDQFKKQRILSES